MAAKEVEVRKRNEEIEAITKDSENTKIILEEKIDAITTDSENTKTILEEKIDAITKDSESTKTILEDKLKDQGKKLKKHEKSITEFRKVNHLIQNFTTRWQSLKSNLILSFFQPLQLPL